MRKLLLFSVLALGGYLGTRYSLALGFNIHFLFGSIFGILATTILGTGWAVAVTAIASSYTFVLWNHPYAIIIFLAEILWVSFAYHKRQSNILFSDTLYWCFLGVPLVALFYAGVMHLGYQFTVVVAIKQAVNGVFNALVANILINHLQLLPRFQFSSPPPKTSFSKILFQFAALFLMVPTLVIMSFDNYRQIEATKKAHVDSVLLESKKAEQVLERWLNEHINAARVIAELGLEYPLKPSEGLQKELARIHTLFPDFHNVFLGDAQARTLAFDPPVNERGESTIGIEFSDRGWFKALTQTKNPVVSDVFMGRGGVFQPIFSISVPLIRNGQILCFGLGATNLDKLRELLVRQSNMRISLIDQSGHVIISNADRRSPLQQIPDTSETLRFPTSSPEVFIQTPKKQTNISSMKIWQNAFFVSKRPVPNTTWSLLIESPVDSLQQKLYASSIQSFALVSCLFVAALGLAVLLSRILGKPLTSITQISFDLPQKIEKGSSMIWPKTTINELSHLVVNFRVMADALGGRMRDIHENNLTLEQTVASRTQELVQSREKLANILEAAPIALGWSNGRGQVEYVNRKFVESLGYERQDIPTVDAWMEKAFPDTGYRRQFYWKWQSEIRRAKESTGELNPFEIRITCKNGSEREMVLEGVLVQEHLLVFFSDITEQKKLRHQLEFQATTDELTGMINRRQFFSVLKVELGRSLRFSRPLSIAMIDIDHFKAINDTYGHPVGDQVLKMFANLCKQSIREMDVLARLGGDEFVLLFPETTRKEALDVTERIRIAVKECPVEVGDTIIHLTISAGIAQFKGAQETDVGLMARADQALYQAKSSGRDDVFVDAV